MVTELVQIWGASFMSNFVPAYTKDRPNLVNEKKIRVNAYRTIITMHVCYRRPSFFLLMYLRLITKTWWWWWEGITPMSRNNALLATENLWRLENDKNVHKTAYSPQNIPTSALNQPCQVVVKSWLIRQWYLEYGVGPFHGMVRSQRRVKSSVRRRAATTGRAEYWPL